MTRVAVIGTGVMGKNHVRVYKEMPETELVAIVDQDPAMAEPASRYYGVPYYTDFHEMVQKERPEAVTVAVNTNAHFQVVSDLLEMGCHVLVEKPIAASLEEADRLIELAEQKERVLAVGHIERFNPAIVELKRRLMNQELGNVFQIHARRLGPFPPRIRDVGVVMDLAIHDLDIMQHLVGHDVTRLFAEAKRTLANSCEDLFVGTLRFDDNTIGLLEINWLTPTKIRELYLTGERGMYRVNYITQDLCFFENAEVNEHDFKALSLLRGVSEGSMIQYAIKKKEPLRAELETFIARVIGKDAPIVSGRDAKKALSLALALVESTRTGCIQEVRHDNISGSIRIGSNESVSQSRQAELSPVSFSEKGG